MYMKKFGGQTKIDILPGQNVPHFTAGNCHLVSKINKYQLLYIFLLWKIVCNIVINFTQFLAIKIKQNPKELY